jgi:hypothetical protein
MSSAPFYMIMEPASAWVAPVGTAFPLLAAAPAGSWLALGTDGNRSFSNDGVKISVSQKVTLARPDGATGPVKAARTEEDVMIELTLWDATVEQVKHALNEAAITTVAAGSGTAGYKSIPLGRGAAVAQVALLVREVSPYGDGWISQYEHFAVSNTGDMSIVYKKGGPAGLLLKFQAMEDLTQVGANKFGTYRAQHQAAL